MIDDLSMRIIDSYDIKILCLTVVSFSQTPP